MRDLVDGPFALKRSTLKALADEVLKAEQPLPEEVLGSDLKHWRQEQLEGRAAYYRRHAIGEPTPGARAACWAQWRRTELELKRRENVACESQGSNSETKKAA